MTTSTMDKRHFTRIPFVAETEIACPPGDTARRCQLVDISLRGALVTRPDGWTGKRDDACHLRLLLAEDGTALDLDVRVAHVEDDRIGCEIVHLDVDSASHLRRLMELNLGDPALLERELGELLVSPPARPRRDG